MHDRRIDNEVHVFGNEGALFMNAMTWFDHETGSAWSQPWGRAIRGEMLGVELMLLPSELTSWGRWRAAHPHTLIMTDDLNRVLTGRQTFRPGFVIGVVLGDASKAYYFSDVAATGAVNDMLAGTPILLWAAGEQYHVFGRQVGDEVLTFSWQAGALRDRETGSSWDAARGIAIAGPLRGQALQSIPSLSSFDWAWRDFYPESEIHQP